VRDEAGFDRIAGEVATCAEEVVVAGDLAGEKVTAEKVGVASAALVVSP